jgi:hypothetical protein
MTKSFLILTFLSYGLIVSAQIKPTIDWVLIPAGTFLMGSPTNEVDRSNNETQYTLFRTPKSWRRNALHNDRFSSIVTGLYHDGWRHQSILRIRINS